jgi:hypothetical protein
MRTTFTVTIDVDEDAIQLEGKRAGLDLDRAREAVRCDLECRLHDAVRYRNGVERVGVRLVTRHAPALVQ